MAVARYLLNLPPPQANVTISTGEEGEKTGSQGLGARRGREQNVIIDREASRQAYKHICDLIAVYCIQQMPLKVDV
jgi:hypothetical protein